jgi:hypothetical protein
MWLDVLRKLGPTDKSFSEEELNLFKGMCGELEPWAPGIGDSLFLFLKTGENPEVLERIAKLEDLSETRFWGYGHLDVSKRFPDREAFYETLKLADTVLLTRFLAVLMTVAQQSFDVMLYVLLEDLPPYKEYDYQKKRHGIPILSLHKFWVACGNAPESLLEELLINIPASFIEDSIGGEPMDKFPDLVA